MKVACISAFLIMCTIPTFAQKVQLSDQAKKKYVRSASTATGDLDVYQIVTTNTSLREQTFRVSVEEPSNEIPTRASKMRFSELEALSKSKYSIKSEVDFLNYLSENEWTLLSVEKEMIKDNVVRRFYIKKTVQY